MPWWRILRASLPRAAADSLLVVVWNAVQADVCESRREEEGEGVCGCVIWMV